MHLHLIVGTNSFLGREIMRAHRNLSPIKRVVWGVEATDEKLQRQTARALDNLLKGTGAVIEPVCVISPPSPYLVRGRLLDLVQSEGGRVEQNLTRLLKKAKLRGVLPVKIQKTHYSSGESVQTLVDYAKYVDADLIAVSSHGREGLSRMLRGSFAESLLLVSPIPVLVVNVHSKTRKPFKHIMCPTDFGPLAQATFDSACEVAKGLRAKITLYHKVDRLTQYAAPSFEGAPIYLEYLQEDVQRRREIAKDLAVQAKRKGIRCEIIIDESDGVAEEAILAKAKKLKVDMIVMASQTDGLGAFLVGSITRQVARHAHCPVWVLHPDVIAKPKKRGKPKARAIPRKRQSDSRPQTSAA